MSYQVNLNNFQGPLDLLLFFIRRDELDIYDIPISSITSEFVSVIKEWEQMNMVVAGEFIDMASLLMRIKVKLLIPRPDLDEEGENIDPRDELIQKLVEYKRYRDAAEMLKTLGKVKKAVDKVAIDGGYDYIIDASVGLLYYKPKFDLTDDVLHELRKLDPNN